MISLTEKNIWLKNFAVQLLPILVFLVVNGIWGTQAGVTIAVLTGLIQLVYFYIRQKRIEKMILFDTAVIVALGGISLWLDNDLFFKLKPAVVQLVIVFILGIHAFSDKPLLLLMGQRYTGKIDVSAGQLSMLRHLSRLLFFVLLFHTGLIVYAAYRLSDEAWGFISAGLFYIIMGIILVGQWLFLLYKQRAAGAGKPARTAQEEWFPLVDEQGKIKGRAQRSAVHGNPSLLHPTVHLHIFNRQGQLYLQKRAMNKDLYPGRWDTAVGGHVVLGESVEQALRREADEELGLRLQEVKPLFRYVMRNPYESELVHAFRMSYEGPFRINRREVEIGRFWNIKEIEGKLGQEIFTPNFEQEYALLKQINIIRI